MRQLFVLPVIFLASTSFASGFIDCKVDKIFSPYLEESLSVDEYPDVTYTTNNSIAEVHLGASSYVDGEDHVSITSMPTFGFRKVVQIKRLNETFTLWSENGVGELSVSYVKNGQHKPKIEKIASLKCKR